MDDKFKLFHEISRFLRTAPQLAVKAWRDGWTEIILSPDGFESWDSCGCCTTGHAPGWYGTNSKGEGRWICGPNGESVKGKAPEGICCL